MSGCTSTARIISQQNQYILEAVRKGDMPANTGTKIIKVNRFNVASPFESYELVHRIDVLRYRTDFYNRFLSSPGSIVADVTRQWLSDSNIFTSVLDTSSSADHHLTLEGTIQAIYGDYRDKNNLRAVLEIRFIVIDIAGTSDDIVFEKKYNSVHPQSETDAKQLVMGLSYCLNQILVDLENDLRKLQQATVVEE